MNNETPEYLLSVIGTCQVQHKLASRESEKTKNALELALYRYADRVLDLPEDTDVVVEGLYEIYTARVRGKLAWEQHGGKVWPKYRVMKLTKGGAIIKGRNEITVDPKDIKQVLGLHKEEA